MAEKGKTNMKQAQSKKLTIQSTIKTVLLSKFQSSNQLENVLKDKLKNIFPSQGKVKIDWGEIVKEKLPKKLRREKIKKMKKEKMQQLILDEDIQVDLQKFILLGFNCVTKQLQAGGVSTVLVNSKLPNNLLSFLLPLCQAKQVPILGLDNLDLITRQVLGFSSSVLGLHSAVKEEENHFFELSKLVLSVWKSSTIVEANASGDVETVGCSTQSNKSKQPKKVVTLTGIKNLHLKRKIQSERVFVPAESKFPSHEFKEQARKKKKMSELVFPYYNSKLL
eukprot:GFUD01014457.1.p1 GENE.GFUD01014457.1~~GFUD01014457.1.p1  ORF type:complete len:279 (-),score=87.00 GFUD01014457.1:34-870(-)